MINAAYLNDQIVLASGFANEAKHSIGIVSLSHSKWRSRAALEVREIDRLTTSHRLRYADIDGSGKRVLIDAPLTGATAEAPEYHGHVPLVSIVPVNGNAKRSARRTKASSMVYSLPIGIKTAGMPFLPGAFPESTSIDCETAKWQRTEIAKGRPVPCPKCGTSDVTVGKLGSERFLATIEPWHGNDVAVYTVMAAGAGHGR